MRLRILLGGVNSEILSGINAIINLNIVRVPITLTHPTELSVFRNGVTSKHPLEVGLETRARLKL